MSCLPQEYDEYFKRAKMLTEIHAKNEKRAMANTTNVMAAGEGAASGVGEAQISKKARSLAVPTGCCDCPRCAIAFVQRSLLLAAHHQRIVGIPASLV